MQNTLSESAHDERLLSLAKQTQSRQCSRQTSGNGKREKGKDEAGLFRLFLSVNNNFPPGPAFLPYSCLRGILLCLLCIHEAAGLFIEWRYS
jgi:hypothetical protein